MDRLRVAVVGTGLFGERHLQAYSSYHRARLIAACDLNPNRVQAMASKYDVPNAYTDYRDMLDNDEVDAVSIATPDHLHREVAIACAQAGKHILVEKPLATTVEDARAISDAAAEAGVTLMVDFHNRLNPPFINIKSSLESGELGDVIHVYARLSNTINVPMKMLSWSTKSSALWFLGSHTIDLVRWLLNDNPVTVFGMSGGGVLRSRGLPCSDVYLATVRFSRGAIAVFENAWILPATQPSVKDFTFELLGSRGAMYVDAANNRLLQKYTDNAAAFPDMLAAVSTPRGTKGFVFESIHHFVDRILDGGAPLAAGEDGVWATKIISAIEESCRIGVPVQIEA